MNYLEQIVAFYRWKEVNPLPASAIALWYEIIAVCNKAGWPEEFTVPNAVLQSNAGLSRREFDRARQMLIDLKRIDYKKSTRVNNAGKYSIIYFLIVQKGQQNVQREGQREGQREVHGRDNGRGTLNNKPKPKQKQNNDPPNISPLIEKMKFGEFVTMTNVEHQNLVDTYGEEFTKCCIEVLDNYKGSSGKKYKSDYRAILNWAVKRVTEDSEKQVRKPFGPLKPSHKPVIPFVSSENEEKTSDEEMQRILNKAKLLERHDSG